MGKNKPAHGLRNQPPQSHRVTDTTSSLQCVQVLDIRLPFDEQQLLRDNRPYLLRALGLSSLNVHSASNLVAAAAVRANVGGAYPAAPVVVFAGAVPAPAVAPAAAV